jgi:hypothetical protein
LAKAFENHEICSNHQLKQVEINPTSAKLLDISEEELLWNIVAKAI